ncbi:glycosyltransferase [Rudaeicoccus suwonensis]|uniref:GT2 family glycosyltransferase n=1 Tax=Rudaeicoccus suwonensis TaxID=657409 RepID=A0A561E8Q9_9MICO|nr:glycosyltransferase family A protein [Rudaeicoccus suwonensis]TWE12002.1 GT2 family glycosyltransferase [Rudaeicoccus suwonensis]
MTTPDVSVIIPCHNAAVTLPLQLEALARQENAPAFEVLVVDNRSGDDPAAAITAWQDRLPALRIVPAADLPGAAYARNVGVAASSADHLLFCDADDLVARDWVRAGHDALQHVEIACGSDVVLTDEEFTTVDAVWADHLDALPGGRVEVRTAAIDYPILLGGNVAIRRSTFVAVGGFDAALVSGNEDNDLAVRAERAGHLINRAPAMRAALRERRGARALFARSRVAARGHIELCDLHDLWTVSPHLRGHAWRLDIVRAGAASARMLIRPASERDWRALAGRWGVAVGFWEGDLRRRIPRRPPPVPLIGAGLRSEQIEFTFAGTASDPDQPGKPDTPDDADKPDQVRPEYDNEDT